MRWILRKKDTILISLIMLASVLAYWFTLLNGFTFDDLHSIVENEYLRDFSFLKYIFSTKYFVISAEASYRPVITILNFAQYFVFGNNPAGYHLINIILHGLTAILIFYFLRKIIDEKIAFAVSLFHAVHPALSESVCAAAFAEDILCLLFIMASLLSAFKFCDSGNSKFKSRIYIFLVCFFYLLALGSKEAAFFLPAGFLVFLPFLKPNRKKVFIVFSGLTAILLFFVFLRFFVLFNPAEKALNRMNEVKNWFSVVYYLIDYLKLYFLPFKLTIIHPVKHIPPQNTFLIVAHWLLFFGLLVSGIFLIRRKKIEGAAILWFLISLAPVSGIIPLKFPFAERFIYIPSLGLHILLACMISGCFTKNKKFMIVLLILSSILVVRTSVRCSQWKTDLRLWKSTLKTSPDSPAVHYALGKIYQDNHFLNKAEKHYIRAIELNRDYTDPYINLAVIYMDTGKLDKALRINDIALSINPDIAIIHLNNALIYKSFGKPDKELDSYEKSIKSDPSFFPAYTNLASFYLKNNQTDNAANIWLQGITVNPRWTEAYINLSKYYLDKSQVQNAINVLRKGLFHNPNDTRLRLYYLKLKQN